jgi:nicotinate-nucleotide adenylyltransferase
MINMTDKIIVYGGAFNPPTIAHQAIAQAAADYAELERCELWLLLSGDRTDKSIHVPYKKRVAYAQGLVASLKTNATIEIVTYELELQEPTKTITTYNNFQKLFPSKQFIWLFGSDSLQTMPSWEEGDYLVNNMNILAVVRSGYNIQSRKNVTELRVVTPLISSTEVRERLKSGESITGLVPETVESMLY